jgi:hypothetical protein
MDSRQKNPEIGSIQFSGTDQVIKVFTIVNFAAKCGWGTARIAGTTTVSENRPATVV